MTSTRLVVAMLAMVPSITRRSRAGPTRPVRVVCVGARKSMIVWDETPAQPIVSIRGSNIARRCRGKVAVADSDLVYYDIEHSVFHGEEKHCVVYYTNTKDVLVQVGLN